jgi:diguanylate cyclase (GGDEF)-like protein
MGYHFRKPILDCCPKIRVDRTLHHIDLITRQRDRTNLEAQLVTALHELLGAQSIRLYKLFSPPGDLLAGLATELDAAGLRMYDDGFSWPDGTASLEHFPYLQECLASGTRCTREILQENVVRQIFQIRRNPEEIFGLVEIDTTLPMSAEQGNLVNGILTVFSNCLTMLDYSEIDSLTRLLNRKTFDESLMRILTRPAETDDGSGPLLHLPKRRLPHSTVFDHWLGVMDIDLFKRINDQFGHMIGDEVLILVANLMRSAFRAQDRLFRFGGEEFVVLLKPTEAENAFNTFDRFRQQIAEHPFPQVGQVTISIGFARIGLHDTPSIVLDNADEALYWAKEHGRNQVWSFERLVAEGHLAPPVQKDSEVELF